MRTFWAFTAFVRVMPGGHDTFPAGQEFYLQCLAAPRKLDDALFEIYRFLRAENLECLDVFRATRCDLDDEEEEIAEYLRSDGEAVAETGKSLVSVYLTYPAESTQDPS